MLPGIERQPRKKLEPSPEWLLGLLHRWRDEAVSAGRTITVVLAAVLAVVLAVVLRGRTRSPTKRRIYGAGFNPRPREGPCPSSGFLRQRAE